MSKEKQNKVEEETVEDLDTGAVIEAEEEDSELALAKKRAEEMTETAQRLQAEFDNYRRRTLESTARIKEDATVAVLMKILPLTDVIAQAMSMIEDESVKKGVKMKEDEIIKMLASYEVVEIEAKGLPFDPKVHEAIMQAPAESEEQIDTVREVFQKGYKMGDRVIRPARVIINK